MNQSEIKVLDKGASSEIKKNGFELNKDGITNWLILKGIIDKSQTLLSYTDLNEWTKTGGETYSAIFSVVTSEKKIKCLIKALATMNPEKGLLDWERRRKILSENGIPVSQWYWQGDGIIIEQYYPTDFSGCKEFSELVRIGFLLGKLGFASLKFLDDLRCDENGNTFFVDFGFDLGEPKSTTNNPALTSLRKTFPSREKDIENILKELDKSA